MYGYFRYQGLKMRKEIVGVHHLKEAMALITRASNLLNQGKDVLPYCLWQDMLKEIKTQIEDHLEIDDISDVGVDD